MRIIKALVALALLLGATGTALAQQPDIPPNTVLGRTGISPGPPQAIPFTTLSTLLVLPPPLAVPPFNPLLTTNMPLIFDGSQVTSGAASGNTITFATSIGTLTNGHCVSIDGSGNFIDAGGACTTGGGGGTVSSGTANQFAYYPSNGSVVAGTPNATIDNSGNFTAGSLANCQTISGDASGKLSCGIQTQFYVSKIGTDSGTCIISAKCLTIAYTLGQVYSASAGGQAILSAGPMTINFGPGIWTESVSMHGMPRGYGSTVATVAGPSIVFNGNGATGGSKTEWVGSSSGVCYTLDVEQNAQASVQNINMFGTGNTCQSTLYAESGGFINVLGGMVFSGAGTSFGAIFNNESKGVIQIWNDFTVDGGANSMANTGGPGSSISFAPSLTITFNASPAFTQLYQASVNAAVIVQPPTTYSGAFSGAKYRVFDNATIDTAGNCASLPGSAGSSFNNGICD